MAASTRARASHHHVDEVVVEWVTVTVDGVDGCVVVVAGPVVVVAGAVVVVAGPVVVVAGSVVVVAGSVVDVVAGGRTVLPVVGVMLVVVRDPAPAVWDGERGAVPQAARSRPAATTIEPMAAAVWRWRLRPLTLIPARSS
jgi:hypothetical protein